MELVKLLFISKHTRIQMDTHPSTRSGMKRHHSVRREPDTIDSLWSPRSRQASRKSCIPSGRGGGVRSHRQPPMQQMQNTRRGQLEHNHVPRDIKTHCCQTRTGQRHTTYVTWSERGEYVEETRHPAQIKYRPVLLNVSIKK